MKTYTQHPDRPILQESAHQSMEPHYTSVLPSATAAWPGSYLPLLRCTPGMALRAALQLTQVASGCPKYLDLRESTAAAITSDM